jgi:hypothetical protein
MTLVQKVVDKFHEPTVQAVILLPKIRLTLELNLKIPEYVFVVHRWIDEGSNNAVDHRVVVAGALGTPAPIQLT